MGVRRAIGVAAALLVSVVISVDFRALPASADARCSDGTYSDADAQGTCSHHGGVDDWLPECAVTSSKRFVGCEQPRSPAQPSSGSGDGSDSGGAGLAIGAGVAMLAGVGLLVKLADVQSKWSLARKVRRRSG